EMQDARLRLGAPGETMSEKEQGEWQEKRRLFFKQTQDSEEERKKKLKKLVQSTPRIATAEWLKVLDRGILNGCGFGLEHFQNAKALSDLGVYDGTQTGITDDDALKAFLGQLPSSVNCLVLSSDQEAKQLSGYNFAKDVLKLTCVLIGDWFHRCWNDLGAAVRKAGLHSIYVQKLQLHNFPRGCGHPSYTIALGLKQTLQMTAKLVKQDMHTRALALAKLVIDKGWASDVDELFECDSWRDIAVPGRPASRPMAARAARAAPTQMRDRCKNGMHAAAKIARNRSITEYGRLIAELTRPFYTDFSEASWRVLDVLKKLLHLKRDIGVLDHCGFTVRFDPATMAELHHLHPAVAHEESPALTFGKLMDILMRIRVGSCPWHTCGYPGKLAIINNPAKLPELFRNLRQDLEVWHAARKQGNATVKAMLKGSTMGPESPFMSWVAAFAQAVEFDSAAAPKQMTDLISKVFQGLGHSRINEDANKLLRDTEGRENPNHNVAFVRMWSALANSKLLQTEERKEIPPESQCSPPCSQLPDKLFKAALRTEGADTDDQNSDQCSVEMEKAINQVTGPQTRSTNTPESQQQRIADFEALKIMHANGLWDKADAAWRAALIPEGALIRAKSIGEVYFAVRSYLRSVLTWPCVKVHGEPADVELWDYCMHVPPLRWRLVWDLDNYEVLPTKHVPPITIAMRGGKSKGVIKQQTGPAQYVPEFQAQAGFAGVPESALRKLRELLKAGSADTSDGDDQKMDLVVALLKKKIVPTKKVHEINAILANAFHEENPEADGAWSEDFETVFDVVTQGEGKDMVQYFE
ncbi:unnamed protein product, partial [Prorocentrum cordatum]